MKNSYLKSIIAGFIGLAALSTLYGLILYLMNRTLLSAWQQFLQSEFWIIALVVGFGIQSGLFWFMRIRRASVGAAASATATSAGVSTLAMAACCAHHLAEILPFLGLSAAALFLGKYQTYFFGLGVISNAIGIYIMISIIKTGKSFGFLKRIWARIFFTSV